MTRFQTNWTIHPLGLFGLSTHHTQELVCFPTREAMPRCRTAALSGRQKTFQTRFLTFSFPSFDTSTRVSSWLHPAKDHGRHTMVWWFWFKERGCIWDVFAPTKWQHWNGIRNSAHKGKYLHDVHYCSTYVDISTTTEIFVSTNEICDFLYTLYICSDEGGGQGESGLLIRSPTVSFHTDTA